MAKILIVEDEQIVAHEMEMALADAGHEVVGIASDEASAVRQAAIGNPELVLMDIKLANNSDGIETAKLMRTRTPVAVIFVSAYLDRGTRQRAALLNPVGYLLKPYSRNQLLHTITAAEAAVGRALARGDAGAVP